MATKQTTAHKLTCDLFVFQQDSAPSYRAHLTVKYLHWATLEFILPDFWLSNSPDTNQIDYRICGCFHDWVYQKQVCHVNALKQHLVEVRSELLPVLTVTSLILCYVITSRTNFHYLVC